MSIKKIRRINRRFTAGLLIVVFFVSPILSVLPILGLNNVKKAEAQIPAQEKVIFLTTTGTQTWTVPADWSDNNKIEVLGAGGGGRVGGASGSGGGGGGAYAAINVTGLTPSGSVTYRVGTGGAAGTAGGDTFFNRTAGSANTCADTVSLCAKGGNGATSATGATGGAVASNKPANVGWSGGAGGSGSNTGDTGGGGGGAAGPNGIGRAGGAGQGAAPGAGGGGGANGTANGSAGSSAGGAGANNAYAFGSGAGAVAAAGVGSTTAVAGTNGGGGGGGAATTTGSFLRSGANGGAGSKVWVSTHAADGTTPSVVAAGPGGGGGGAGATTSNGTGSIGGNGANYGAGGGGAYTTAGTGAQGIIVITYVPSTVTVKTVFLTTTGTQTWTVPADWSDDNEIIVLGAGGGGRVGSTAGGGGGGGGAIATSTVLGLSPSGSVTYRVGTGGAAGTTGGDTFFNRTAGAANTCADTVSVCAKGGTGASSATGGAGGVIASNKPAYSGYPGGTGGAGNNTGDTSGGGGGAASIFGAGRTGGAGQGAAPGAGGGGGGVGGLGAAGSSAGGAGGVSFAGTNGGAGAVAAAGVGSTTAVAGTNGGGGGGGAATTTSSFLRSGAAGSNSIIWTQTSDSATIGPGSGGGGGGATTGAGVGSVGGAGGYGAGGGGAYTTAGIGGQGFIIIRYVPSGETNTLGDGTDPGNSTIAPGAAATDMGQFSLVASAGTDTVTALTVTLSPSNSFNNIAKVEITDTSDVDECTDIDNPASLTLNFTGCSLAVTTSPTEFKIRITPKTHANMAAPATGVSYAVTGTVTAITGTNGSAGTDTNGGTITIDNLSPANVTSSTATAGDTQTSLAWTNPVDADLFKVMVLASTTAITFVPVEGTTYATSTLAGASRVACYGLQVSCIDLSLSNGTAYYYKIFTLDSNGNWSDAGVTPTGSPVTPFAPISISGTCLQADGSTACADDGSNSIKFAINGSIQAGTDTVVDGSWSITGISPPSAGAIITVFIDGNADANEASAVIEYDGTGDITVVELLQDALTVGSGSDATVLSNADLGQYDGDNDEDLRFTSNAGVLSAGSLVLLVIGASTYTPGGAVTADIFYSDNGTTNGGSASWTLTDFILDGGTFTSTSGTMRVYGNFTNSAGTFNDGGGTVHIASNNGSPDNSPLITGNTTFNNLILSDGSTSNCCNSDSFTVEVATTLTVNGTLTMEDTGGQTASLNTGTIHAKGDVDVVTDGLSGTGLIILNKGSGTQTIYGDGVSSNMPNVELAGGGSGTIAISGTIRVNGNWTYTSGTISPGASTVVFRSLNGIPDQTPTISGSHTLNNVIFEDGVTNNCCSSDTITLTTGTTLTASGDVTFNDMGGAELNINGGTIDIKGNLTVTGNNIFGNASTTLSGAGNTQTITTGGFTIPTGVFTINKSSGSAVLAGNLILGTSQPVNITSGTFDQGATYNFRAGAVTVGASGVWTNTGTGDVTLGGNVSNAGTITLDSSGGGCGDADGIVLTSTASAQRTWSGAGTFQLYDLAVSWMAGTITTTSSTNSGNNTGWTFGSCGGGTITVAGTLYGTNGSTPIDCSTGGNRTVRVKVNGAGAHSADCTLNTGAYSVGSVAVTAIGDVITVFLDEETENANTVTLIADTSSGVTANLYQNHLIVRSESATAVTNTHLNNFDANTGDCAGGTGDSDMLFCVTSGELTVLDGAKLLVWTGDTFTPGGAASTSPSSNSSTLDGDVEIQASATLNMEANALSVGGDFVNAGTFSESGSPQVTTFTATASGHSIDNGTGNLDKVVFNGSNGGWSFTDSSNTIADDITVTAGTLSGGSSLTVNGGDVTGNGSISITGGTFTLDGTGSFGGDTSWTFRDLVFGNGSGSETTTGAGTGSITASTTSISANQTFNSGAKTLNISGASYFTADTVAVVDTGSAQAAVTNTVSLTNLDISGTNKVVYVHVGIRGLDNGATVSSVTVGGVNAELVTTTTDSATMRGELWRLIAPANGTGVTVTANLSANASASIFLGAISLSGVDQTDPDEALNSQSGTFNTLSSTNVTTLTNGALLVDFVHHRNDIDILEGTGQTNRLEHNNGATIQGISTKPKNIAGQASMAWTNGAVQGWNHTVVSVKPYVSGLTNPFVISGTFTPSSGTVQYSGVNTTHVATSTYNGLTLGGTGSYRLPYGGLVLTGNLTVTDGATVVEPAGGDVAFAGGTTQTVLDYNNALKQDIGDIKVASSGYTNDWCGISTTACNTSWTARRKVIFSNAVSNTDLTNFPVLVSLTSANIDYSKTQNSGQDIRFVDADGTALSYEIERWDETATSTVWVKIPTLSRTNTDYIWMYYGNATVADNQSPTSVWDSSYKAVWHLGEDLTDEGTSGTNYDSTTNDNDGTQNGNFEVVGKIGYAQDFDGTNDYVQKTAPTGFPSGSGQSITSSGWIYGRSTPAGGTYYNLTSYGDSTDYIGVGVVGTGSAWVTYASGAAEVQATGYAANRWFHLTSTYDGTNVRMYVNGELVAGPSARTITLSNNHIKLGCWSGNPLQNCTNGYMDEIRVSNTARSADWIKAEYRSTNNEMATYSAEETQNSGDPAWCSISSSACNSSWLNRKPVYFSNASSTLTNFPVLITLNSSNIDYSKTKNAGEDIRFVDADGTTALSYEIERWDETATSTVWVKVPTLSNTNADYIWMYYNNTGATDNQSATAVWDSNYKAVWHFRESGNGTANEYIDSTSNVNHGRGGNGNASNVPVRVVGKLGYAQDVVDGTDFIEVADSASLDAITTNASYSIWMNLDTLDANWQAIFNKGPSQQDYGLLITNSGEITAGSVSGNVIGPVYSQLNNWAHVAVEKIGTATHIYINGVRVHTGTGPSSYSTNNETLRIGNSSYANESAKGVLDEIRISDASRSPDWFKAEYRTANNEMSAFGAEEVLPVGTTLNLSSTVRVTDVTIDSLNTLSLNGNNALVVSGNDFTNNGTFDSSTGTFVAVPNITETPFLIRGSNPTTFNNFTANKPLTMLRFKSSQTFTIGGTLNISGIEGKPVQITSDTPNSQWTLYLTGSGSVNHVVVKDSACHGSSNSVVVDFINNQGNNGPCLVAISRGSAGAIDNSGGGSGASGGGFGGGGGASDSETLPLTFTDSDGVGLIAYNNNWTINNGAFAINTNAVYSNTQDTDTMAHWTGGNFNANQFAEITINAVTGGAYIGVAVRVGPSGHNGYTAYTDGSATEILEWNNGSQTQHYNGATSFAPGDVLRLEVSGTNITLKKNGSVVTTVSDATFTNGRPGLAGYHNGSGTRGDGWTAGSIEETGGGQGGGGGGASP